MSKSSDAHLCVMQADAMVEAGELVAELKSRMNLSFHSHLRTASGDCRPWRPGCVGGGFLCSLNPLWYNLRAIAKIPTNVVIGEY